MPRELDIKDATAAVRNGYAYWREKCAGRLMPTRSDLKPAEMVSFLTHVILLDVLHGPLDFSYRLVGSSIDLHTHGRLTGCRMSDLPHQRKPSTIWAKMERIVESGQPSTSEVPYVGPHRDFLSVQDFAAPLGDAESGVTMIFIVVDFVARNRHLGPG